MSKRQKKIITAAVVLALMFGIVPNVSAMHIMEGYLPGGFCIAWGVLCIPFFGGRTFFHSKDDPPES